MHEFGCLKKWAGDAAGAQDCRRTRMSEQERFVFRMHGNDGVYMEVKDLCEFWNTVIRAPKSKDTYLRNEERFNRSQR